MNMKSLLLAGVTTFALCAGAQAQQAQSGGGGTRPTQTVTTGPQTSAAAGDQANIQSATQGAGGYNRINQGAANLQAVISANKAAVANGGGTRPTTQTVTTGAQTTTAVGTQANIQSATQGAGGYNHINQSALNAQAVISANKAAIGGIAGGFGRR